MKQEKRHSLPIVLCNIQKLCAINPPLIFINLLLVDGLFLDQTMNKIDQQVLCVRTWNQVHKQQGAVSHFLPI